MTPQDRSIETIATLFGEGPAFASPGKPHLAERLPEGVILIDHGTAHAGAAIAAAMAMGATSGRDWPRIVILDVEAGQGPRPMGAGMDMDALRQAIDDVAALSRPPRRPGAAHGLDKPMFCGPSRASHVIVSDGRVQMDDDRPSWQTPYGPRGGSRRR